MRKLLLFLSMIILVSLSANADVIINEENFPDENFRNFLIEYYGQNGVIPDEEISEINTLILSMRNIENLKGIELFTELRELYCSLNPLTSLDISKNKKLEKLESDITQLTSLDVSNNTALTFLSCTFNNLTSLDVSKNTALTLLSCPGNQLTSLDVSHNTVLEELNCERNQLTTLNVSHNPELVKLECLWNLLTSLDITNNTKLKYFSCEYNQLTTLDLSNNAALTGLYCGNNMLETISLPLNSSLKIFYCRNNRLKTLDISKSALLELLYCENNLLSRIDVSDCPALCYLYCYNNQIAGAAMDHLVGNLQQQESAYFGVFSDDNSEGNVCTKDQVNIARQKGWQVLGYFNKEWKEYEGCDPATIEMISNSNATIANVYTVSGQRINDAYTGLKIIRMSNGTTKKIVIK